MLYNKNSTKESLIILIAGIPDAYLRMLQNQRPSAQAQEYMQKCDGIMFREQGVLVALGILKVP